MLQNAVSADEAVAGLRSGANVFLHGAATTPLIEAMCRLQDLTDVKLCHMHTEGPAPFLSADCCDRFTSISQFTGQPARKAVHEGLVDLIQIFLSDMPSLFREAVIRLDAALLQVSPPDRQGFCSLRTSMDSGRLFDLVNDNPLVSFLPCDVTNITNLLRKTDRLVAVNSALQIDLTGQICADSMGHRICSGSGGQMDFMRDAAVSRGGLPITALPSTAADGTCSRIFSERAPGPGVVTIRGRAHWAVTGSGAVNLHGLSLRQRGEKLISIAHPDFRSQL